VVLDHLSEGRLQLGLGRGAARIEFEGFGVPMGESRDRFIRDTSFLLETLETGRYSHADDPTRDRDLRPAPFKTFDGRVFAAAVSPASMRIMAELGVALLVVAQKPWDAVAADMRLYRQTFREVNGREAPPPAAACWIYCHEDDDFVTRRAQEVIGRYYHAAMNHYELGGAHFANTKGYEFYAKVARHTNARGADAAVQEYVDLHVWGTPQQCFEKIMHLREVVGCDTLIAVPSYANMPFDEVERSAQTFAKHVMPRLQALGPAQLPDEAADAASLVTSE
jgi:alkanesulfonate monooxygenase SsuD/methylene tetrahydromethanopterin reductase-like flavin-dependent oxidoreductase (luciferase family)